MSSTSRMSTAHVMEEVEPGILAQTFWILLFAGVTALGAQIEVMRYPVPYTLQTFFVLLAGAFLGPRNGAISQFAYLAAGLMGAPVFSSGGFGLAKLIGPTGGYLLSFPVTAAVVGYLVQGQRSTIRTFLAMAVGLVVIFVCGTIQLYAVLLHDWSAALASGLLVFSWWDIVKLAAAAMIYHEFAKRWPRVPAA